MRRRTAVLGFLLVLLGLGSAWFFGTSNGRAAQFVVGGALVNLGYRMQDHLTSFDFDPHHAHGEGLTPGDVWAEVQRQNRMAADVRTLFPRTPHHPLVAMVVCMDARLDTNELTGDTRKYYYVIRTAGSAIEDEEGDMLELAVANGVKLILLTTHSECAAERAAADPAQRQRYPALTRSVLDRGVRLRELLARPFLAAKIQDGELLVKQLDIDTRTEQMLPR